jgi:hypothetical protein
MIVGRRLLGRRWLYRGSWEAEDTAEAGHLPVNHGIVPSARSHRSRMAWARWSNGPAECNYRRERGQCLRTSVRLVHLLRVDVLPYVNDPQPGKRVFQSW